MQNIVWIDYNARFLLIMDIVTFDFSHDGDISFFKLLV
jgi:hypothetical protein